MLRILFLDDQHSRLRALRATPTPKVVTWAKDAAEAIRELSSRDFDIVMLDHDLALEHYAEFAASLEEGRKPEYGGGEATGMRVAEWMVENAELFRRVVVVVHSLNGPAAERMTAVLADAGLDVRRMPFAWTRI